MVLFSTSKWVRAERWAERRNAFVGLVPGLLVAIALLIKGLM